MIERRSIGRLVSCLHRLTASHVHGQLEKYGIGSGQILFLMGLYRSDNINQDQLAREVRADKATCTRAIKKLEKAGYVRRSADESDRRAYRIHLTEKARKLRPIIEKVLGDWTKHLLTGFSEEEKERLFNFLERLVANAAAKKQGDDAHV